MKSILDIEIKSPDVQLGYNDSVLLMGSCFTEHIGGRLADSKFSVLQNPNGILFDPISVCNSLMSYMGPDEYAADDLFYLDELHQSWKHHSLFSGMDANEVLQNINYKQQEAHGFLQNADWLIVTLGSSFHYRLVETGQPVANCHRAPGQWFTKHLLTIEETVAALENCMHRLFHFNDKLKIIFTISPVRHVRDGVIENNRSKARLIEAVHHLVNKFDRLYYFPAYELVIDVLRDYRYYDIDLVHPNYAATDFVFQKFAEHFIEPAAQALMAEVKSIGLAYRHKPFQSGTQGHKNFLESSYQKAKTLHEKFPFLNLDKELAYFSTGKR